MINWAAAGARRVRDPRSNALPRTGERVIAASQSESGSITIAGSQDRVWHKLIALDGLTDWYDDFDSCEHGSDEQRLREGLTFRLRTAGTRRATAECRVVTVVEPILLRWIEHRPRHAPVLVEFRLTAHAPDSTVVTHSKTTGRRRRKPRDQPAPA